jgi:hypothetical protein
MAQHFVAALTKQPPDAIRTALVGFVPVEYRYRMVVVNRQRLTHALRALTNSARTILVGIQFGVPLRCDPVRGDQASASGRLPV